MLKIFYLFCLLSLFSCVEEPRNVPQAVVDSISQPINEPEPYRSYDSQTKPNRLRVELIEKGSVSGPQDDMYQIIRVNDELLFLYKGTFIKLEKE